MGDCHTWVDAVPGAGRAGGGAPRARGRAPGAARALPPAAVPRDGALLGRRPAAPPGLLRAEARAGRAGGGRGRRRRPGPAAAGRRPAALAAARAAGPRRPRPGPGPADRRHHRLRLHRRLRRRGSPRGGGPSRADRSPRCRRLCPSPRVNAVQTAGPNSFSTGRGPFKSRPPNPRPFHLRRNSTPHGGGSTSQGGEGIQLRQPKDQWHSVTKQREETTPPMKEYFWRSSPNCYLVSLSLRP